MLIDWLSRAGQEETKDNWGLGWKNYINDEAIYWDGEHQESRDLVGRCMPEIPSRGRPSREVR